MNNSKTITAKFEEFFATEYKDEVFHILEEYPAERGLIVDYLKLEMFDPCLADLLCEKPDEVIQAAQIAIINIDPLVKNVDIFIKFNNFNNVVSFDDVNSKYVGSFLVIEGTVFDVDKPRPQLDVGIFECRGCMRLHEVEQVTHKNIIEPSLCSECGSRQFRLLEDKSKFRESQRVILGSENSSKRLDVLFLNDDCSYDEYAIGNNLRITGTLKAIELKEGFDYFFEANLIEKLDYITEVPEDIKKGDRNSPEYRIWQKAIIEHDKVCQCCGGHKHLEAHHIFGYKNNPSYRVNLENGVALCKWCHGKYHSYYGKDATPKNLIKFLKRFGGNNG